MLDKLAVHFAVALLQTLENHFRGLGEGLLGFALVETESIELNPSQTAAKPGDYPALGQVIQHRQFLGNPDRVMPGQNHRHGAQLDFLGFACQERQPLGNVRAHGVTGEVVFHTPDRIIAKTFSLFGHFDFMLVNVEIIEVVPGVLEDAGQSNFHSHSPTSPRRGRSSLFRDKKTAGNTTHIVTVCKALAPSLAGIEQMTGGGQKKALPGAAPLHNVRACRALAFQCCRGTLIKALVPMPSTRPGFPDQAAL